MTRLRVRAVVLAGALAACAIVAPAAAHADPDTDFANTLHTYGVYGPRDYNAWIAKITCQRVDRGVDQSAYDSAEFVSRQLSKGSTTEQAWQFVALTYQTYCPDKQALLQQVADRQGA